MPEEPDASDLPPRTFPIVRKGYERGPVDRYLSAIGDRLEQLEAEVARYEDSLKQLGLDDAKDLARELDAVGNEVARVLQAAREAAEQMRSRAAADASTWRADADAESRTSREEAAADAEALRRGAWEEGTEMLEQAVAEHERLLEDARQEALFVRAEAEREALRLTGDARRDREEELRAAHEEAERVIATARQESGEMISTARQQAEAAQERARALEARRAELLEELEAARASIGGLVQQAAESGDVAPVSPSEVVVRDEGGRWPENEGSVRIVAPTRVISSTPVDAVEIAAEVEEMRSGAGEPEPELEPEPEPELDSEPKPESGPEPEPESEPESESEPQPESESEAEPEPQTESEPDSDGGREGDVISELFDSLRSAPADGPARMPSSPVTDQIGPREPEPAPLELVAPVKRSPGSGPRAREATLADGTAFGTRERLLLPVQNRALRSIKRLLVDLQNEALEELRLEDAWTPDAVAVTGSVTEPLGEVVRESTVSGFVAAAELTGRDAAPQPPSVAMPDAAPDFAAALGDATIAALERSRSAGAGSRETAAGLSRVFRSWRTDEAERRVRNTSQAAYHRGLVAGLADLGVPAIVGVPQGRSCPQCPVGRGSWSPAGEPPEGSVLPPARIECTCTVAPVE